MESPFLGYDDEIATKRRLLRKALASMEKLVNNGSFFCGAIELDINFAGDAYEEELRAIIDEIKKDLS